MRPWVASFDAGLPTRAWSLAGSGGEHPDVHRFLRLDGMRGWLSWLVVLAHIVFLSGLQDQYKVAAILYNNGPQNVFAFVILSGFVITHLLLTTRETYGQFITRRFFRLFPVFLVCCAAAIAVAFGFGDYLSGWGSGPHYSPDDVRLVDFPDEDFAAHVFAHLTMLHGMLPDSLLPHAPDMFLIPAWSISLEWQFYLIAPLAVYVAMRKTGGVELALAAFVLTGLYHFGAFGSFTYPSLIFGAAGYFLVGIMSRLLLPRVIGAVTAPLTIALILGCILLISRAHHQIFPFALWGAVFAILCTDERRLSGANGAFLKLVDALLTKPTVLWLGRISYSVYLSHAVVLVVVQFVLLRLFPDISRLHCAVLLTIIGAPLILCISHLLHTYIELPGIALGRRLASRMRSREDVLLAHQERQARLP